MPPSPGALAGHALAFGGAAGAIMALWLLLEYAGGLHGEHVGLRSYSAMASLAVPIAAIAIGTMRWRDRGLGGSIRFTQAFGCALAIGLVFAVIVGLFSWLYVAAISPGFIETLIDQQAAMMRQSGSSPEEIVRATETARATATPQTYAFAVFAQMLVSVFFISLLASVVLRRRS